MQSSDTPLPSQKMSILLSEKKEIVDVYIQNLIKKLKTNRTLTVGTYN